MSNNMIEDTLIQDVLNEVNTFTGSMNQLRIGFVNLFSVAMKKLMDDYKARGLLIEKLKERVANLEKELEILREKSN